MGTSRTERWELMETFINRSALMSRVFPFPLHFIISIPILWHLSTADFGGNEFYRTKVIVDSIPIASFFFNRVYKAYNNKYMHIQYTHIYGPAACHEDFFKIGIQHPEIPKSNNNKYSGEEHPLNHLSLSAYDSPVEL